MLRKNFKNIIKNRSFWKIDRRKGNYKLPNGNFLNDYVTDLVWSQMELDSIAIRENGNFADVTKQPFEKREGYDDFDYILCPAFEGNEVCSLDEMEWRVKKLVWEIVG